MKTVRIPIRVVFYKEGSFWIAHCLEFDLVGSGRTRKGAVKLLAEAVEIQLRATAESRNLGNLIRPADSRYFMMYAKGKDVADGQFVLKVGKVDHFEIEPTDYREFTDSESELASA